MLPKLDRVEQQISTVRRTSMKRSKQSRVVDVDKGLVLVRYATAGDEKRPPKIELLVNPRDEKHIEIVLNPHESDAVLWRPGACLVVRANRPGQLFVEVVPIDDDGSTAATVKIEMLSQGEKPARRAAVPESRAILHTKAAVGSRTGSSAALGVDFDRLKISGHVAGIGDVTARADDWIAGPAAPARIEGLLIEWPDKPPDIDISYSVTLARPHAVSGRMMQLGDYAGTRGRALPIVGITLDISGAGAADLRLSAEAAFLGAPIARTTGKQVELSGPTGREPLVGFRLRVDEINMPLQPVLTPAAKTRPPGRVRVFRSSAAQGQLRSTPPSFADATGARAVSE
jgi:hypothetical protein